MPLLRSATYLLPNRNTLGLAAVLVAMWYAGTSQNNGAAYLLCFLISAVAMISSAHTWANLKGVSCDAGAVAPVYAGSTLVLPILARSTNGRSHFGLTISSRKSRELRIPELSESSRLELVSTAPHRGRYDQVEIVIRSVYPLGFFTARRRVLLSRTYYVYPAPEGDRPFPDAGRQQRESADGKRRQGDDFAGVRGWTPGESMRHIDWKAAARNDTLLVKQWQGSAGRELWLEWEALEGLETEARLRQFARWLLLAEAQGLEYGLAIPGTRLTPSHGDTHLHQCMRALAAFEDPRGFTPSAPLPHS